MALRYPESKGGLGKQIDALTQRLYQLIRDSLKIAEYRFDPEMTADLYYQVRPPRARSASPDARAGVRRVRGQSGPASDVAGELGHVPHEERLLGGGRAVQARHRRPHLPVPPHLPTTAHALFLFHSYNA